MANFIRRFLLEEDGPTATEYAVMLALIVGACLASVKLMSEATANSFNTSGAQLAGVLGS